ncbi:hypothetical protein JCM19000A_17920 [Silvimonas sp. JCM 19000]
MPAEHLRHERGPLGFTSGWKLDAYKFGNDTSGKDWGAGVGRALIRGVDGAGNPMPDLHKDDQ